MENKQDQDSGRKPGPQGVGEAAAKANKINASTPYDFEARNLSPYGGLLPVANMLEKLNFQQLVEETVTVKRKTSMPMYRFVLAMMLAAYAGFSRLNQLRFLRWDPMLTGILEVVALPVQSTFWRFLSALHLGAARQLLEVQRQMRIRVWQAANVQLSEATLDTDTTVHTLFGNQMGGRKGYNPKAKGKKSYQPMLTFLAETKEYVTGSLRTGDRPSGKEIAAHLEAAVGALPAGVKTVYARADSGFYCQEAVRAYEKRNCQFIVVARKTPRLVEKLNTAKWKLSPRTDADGQCEFEYQPEGWDKAYRFLALRYEKKAEPAAANQPEQYQLFDTPEYSYRVFVTNMKAPLDALVGFYRNRATSENLIKEANNDAGLAAHPSNRWTMNAIWFQIAMLAYNLNCWLSLFNREDSETAEQRKHTTLATARLRFLFLAVKFWSHGGRTGVHYSDHYPERGIFERLLQRVRSIGSDGGGFRPVIATPLLR
ncbi:MAG: IS1380 family transposase [Acidobacteria bacterium]|nr:IS1380 family transposase [Acidobacteriota bacterium]